MTNNNSGGIVGTGEMLEVSVLLRIPPLSGVTTSIDWSVSFLAADFTALNFSCRNVTILPEFLSYTFTVQKALHLSFLPEPVRKAAAAVVTVGTAVSFVSANPTGAMQQKRLQSFVGLGQCVFHQEEDLQFSDSPLGLSIGENDPRFLGALVGNLLLQAGVVLVVVSAMCILRYRAVARSWNDACGALRFPGLLVVPYAILLQPSLTSAVALFSPLSSSTSGGVTAFAVMAVVCFVVPIPVTALFTATQRFKCRIGVSRGELPPAPYEKYIPGLYPLVTLQMWSNEWIDTSQTKFKRKGKMVFGDFNRPWFMTVNLLVSAVQGLVLGWRNDSIVVCRVQLVVLLIANCVLFVLTVWLRPCTTAISNGFAIYANAAATLAALLALIGSATQEAVDYLATLSNFVLGVQSFMVLTVTLVLLIRYWYCKGSRRAKSESTIGDDDGTMSTSCLEMNLVDLAKLPEQAVADLAPPDDSPHDAPGSMESEESDPFTPLAAPAISNLTSDTEDKKRVCLDLTIYHDVLGQGTEIATDSILAQHHIATSARPPMSSSKLVRRKSVRGTSVE